MRIGYFLSCEEYAPRELLAQARLAERHGFHGLWISDHYHPWIEAQGQSPFVWSVIGALAEATERLSVTTGVTCPTVRIHPAIIAQAAATSAVMLEGSFALGVGSGEALNEHIFGDAWPRADVRLEMLEEAVDILRELWTGRQVRYTGAHYEVENARIYTLPETPPQVLVSGFGPPAGERPPRFQASGLGPRWLALAGRIGAAYYIAMPDKDLIGRSRATGGDKPVHD